VVLVRAGLMARDTLERATGQSFERFGVFGFSVEAVLDGGVAEACRTSPRLRHYPQVRLSTVGRIRDGGLILWATFDRPHFTVLLPDLSEVTLARVDRCFDPPIPNPGLAKRL
jgi:hypothetical protein